MRKSLPAWTVGLPCGSLIIYCLIDPRGRPVVIIIFAHVVRSYVRPYIRPSVPTFQNKTNFKRKQRSPLARLWVWRGGSLMTPVLFFLGCPKKFLSLKVRPISDRFQAIWYSGLANQLKKVSSIVWVTRAKKFNTFFGSTWGRSEYANNQNCIILQVF